MSRTDPRTPDPARFFVSYAHSAPMPDWRSDTDPWVRRCFDDLSREVAALLRTDQRGVGFIDYLVEPGEDWKARITEKLDEVAVFVPLYSPGYFNKAWPMREHASFQHREQTAFAGREPPPRTQIVPVLWIPLPAWDRFAELEPALTLASGMPEYAENGLRALCMLASYREHYEKVVKELAASIADRVRTSELPRGGAVALDEIGVPEPRTTDTPFVVGIVASASAFRPGPAYRSPATIWRPFGDAQAVPVVEFIVDVAERLGLPTRTVDRRIDYKALDTSPAVVLVDPWVLAEGDDSALTALAPHLHPWVTSVVVTDRHDLQYQRRGAELTAKAYAKLQKLGAGPVVRVLDVEQLTAGMPLVISDARRQFLHRVPADPGHDDKLHRPRLGDDGTAAGTRTEESTDD